MTKEDFIKKWNVAFESKEQELDYAQEMFNDLSGLQEGKADHSLADEKSAFATPHKCPICTGTGIVPGGFYNQTSGSWSSTSLHEQCRQCVGSGLVWSPSNPQASPTGTIRDEETAVKFADWLVEKSYMSERIIYSNKPDNIRWLKQYSSPSTREYFTSGDLYKEWLRSRLQEGAKEK